MKFWRGIAIGMIPSCSLGVGYFIYKGRHVEPFIYDSSSSLTKKKQHFIKPPLLNNDPITLFLSQIGGAWIDKIFAYGAGYGRGKLHFKTGGWGHIGTVERCSNALKAQSLSERSIEERANEIRTWFDKDSMTWDTEWKENEVGCWYRDGSFPTPLIKMFGEESTDKMLYKVAQRCYFRYVVPSTTNPSDKPLIFGTAATAATTATTATAATTARTSIQTYTRTRTRTRTRTLTRRWAVGRHM